MKIQILSDLHLERLTMSKLWKQEYPINCDILCLVGDIGNPFDSIYWSFMDYARQNAKYVLIVAGNHECWGSNIYQVNHKISSECKKVNNVFYLQNDVFIYGEFIFLGCTLWSHIPNKYHEQFQKHFPDFKNIQNCIPFSFNMWHSNDKICLKIH